MGTLNGHSAPWSSVSLATCAICASFTLVGRLDEGFEEVDDRRRHSSPINCSFRVFDFCREVECLITTWAPSAREQGTGALRAGFKRNLVNRSQAWETRVRSYGPCTVPCHISSKVAVVSKCGPMAPALVAPDTRVDVCALSCAAEASV